MELRLPRKSGPAAAAAAAAAASAAAAAASAAAATAVTAPESHVCAVLLSEFDITTGSSLRAVYPPNFFSEAEIKQYRHSTLVLSCYNVTF